MREIKIKVTEQLYTDLKRGSKSVGLSVAQFAAQRLSMDRYDLITEELIKEGHITYGRCDKNETVL